MPQHAEMTIQLPLGYPPLAELMQRLPGILSGIEPDPYGIVTMLQLRVGMVLLSKIKQAFITKSRGGAGDDGITWKPLDPKTIAQRRVTREEYKVTGTARGSKGVLTPAQITAWNKIFARNMRWLEKRHGDKEAKKIASSIAWKYVKEKMGARTVQDVFGSRQVDILRDTGELLKSLNPGVGAVMENTGGYIAIGTNKKPWHHAGTSRIPTRPFWPPGGVLPDTWWQAMIEEYRQGVLEAIVSILARPV